jgi:hypothetical protein
MEEQPMIKSTLSALVSLASLAVMAALPASAVTAKSFKYPSPKTGYLQLPATSMVPDGNASANNYSVAWPMNLLEGVGCFNSTVHLPDRSNIVDLTIIHTGALAISLFETSMLDGLGTELVFTSTSAVGARVATTFPLATPRKINNETTMYSLGICLDVDELFHGARIKYTYTTAGD